MAWKTIQVRLLENIFKEIETEVKKGNYESKSDYIRSNLSFKRDFKDLIGLLPNTGDSVKEVREIRKKLSKEIKTIEDFKKLNELIE